MVRFSRSASRGPLLPALLGFGGLLLGSSVMAAPDEPASVKQAPVALEKLTPLETAGRDVFLAEGCADCHGITGLPRTELLKPDARTDGPSLDLIGGMYPVSWHYHHLVDPERVMPAATMPPGPELFEDPLNIKSLTKAMAKQAKKEGKPTTPAELASAMETQATPMVEQLATEAIDVSWDVKGMALTAFLMRVGDEERQAMYDAAQAEKAAEKARVAAEYAVLIAARDQTFLIAGENVYQQSCAACHGKKLTGGIGPDLTDDTWIHGGSFEQISATVRSGVPQKGCPTLGPVLGEEKVAQVAGFIFATAEDAKSP